MTAASAVNSNAGSSRHPITRSSSRLQQNHANAGAAGIPEIPPNRAVARPIANLGNTCYMNAVLQALSHAPELCMAMDCDPHRAVCPTALRFARRDAASSSSASDVNGGGGTSQQSPASDDAAAAAAMAFATPSTVTSGGQQQRKQGTRKSLRSGRRSPPDVVDGSNDNDSGGGGSNHGGRENASPPTFCTLCEIEQHITAVHDAKKKDPVAPVSFVNGFMQHVAPWFQLGVQEDSHEFLRVLIDAMQKSCQAARKHQPRIKKEQQPASEEKSSEAASDKPQDKDTEYPFSLFRGTVESNVICGSCKASSATLDPIEDVGLDVATARSMPSATSESTSSRRNASSSPVPAAPLQDVQAAFSRFARAEALDAGYKCEKCGKVGSASKQSRLASIPPILTLHLKRFRYGDSRGAPVASGGGTSTRRSRSEVSQLLGSNAADFIMTGKSGSAKIEGCVKFDIVFDLKPYLTEKLQKEHKSMFCRLFAVIVHAGKNSHSGHYYAYVQNVGNKNEWWKMDDSRVSQVSEVEVKNSEAYMLFYRVMQHPISVQLEERHKAKLGKQQSETETNDLVDPNKAAVAMEATPKSFKKEEPHVSSSSDSKNKVNKKKRPPPSHDDGLDWAKNKTKLPRSIMALIPKMQEMVANNVRFEAEMIRLIEAEARKENAALGQLPKLSFTEGDVIGGTEKFKKILLDIFYRLRNEEQFQEPNSPSAEDKDHHREYVPPSEWFQPTGQDTQEEGGGTVENVPPSSTAGPNSTTNNNNSTNRVAVVEPEEMYLL